MVEWEVIPEEEIKEIEAEEEVTEEEEEDTEEEEMVIVEVQVEIIMEMEEEYTTLHQQHQLNTHTDQVPILCFIQSRNQLKHFLLSLSSSSRTSAAANIISKSKWEN